eukprot:SAG11_NODE_5495_length_1544_cov_1.276125_1_plen_237_part_00
MPNSWLLQWNQTQLVPCIFNLRADPREQHDLSAAKPALLQELWSALNTSLYGYYHSRTPPPMLGPCNMPCARRYWTSLSGSANNGGPVCGVLGCKAGPPPPPLPPPGPQPHFKRLNSSHCSWVDGAQYNHRVRNGAITSAADREGYYRNCYQNTTCVAAAFHEDETGTCYLHYSLGGQHRGQTGVVGCVTNRSQSENSLVSGWLGEEALVTRPWPPLFGDSKMEWVGGMRQPDWVR